LFFFHDLFHCDWRFGNGVGRVVFLSVVLLSSQREEAGQERSFALKKIFSKKCFFF